MPDNQFGRIYTSSLINIEKILDSSVTKFYNGGDVNVIHSIITLSQNDQDLDTSPQFALFRFCPPSFHPQTVKTLHQTPLILDKNSKSYDFIVS